MDGVVIDSEKLYYQSEKKLLCKYGIKLDNSDWRYIKGCTEKEFYDEMHPKDLCLSKLENVHLSY